MMASEYRPSLCCAHGPTSSSEAPTTSGDLPVSCFATTRPEKPQPDVFPKSRAAPPPREQAVGWGKNREPATRRRPRKRGAPCPKPRSWGMVSTEHQLCEASKFRILPQRAKRETTELLFCYRNVTTRVPRSCTSPVINFRSSFRPLPHNPANLESEGRLVVAKGWRWEWGLTVHGMRDLLGAENVLELIYVDTCAPQ